MKRLHSLLIALLVVSTLGQAQNLFSRIYEKPSYGYAWDVCETIDKGYIIVGQIWSTQNHNDIYAVKTDQFGDTLWTKSIGGIGNDYGYSIKQTIDKGYIIVGSTTNFFEESYDVYVVKISENGEVIWTKTFGGTRSDSGVSVELTDDNGFIILGRTDSFGFEMGNPYLIRINSTGDSIWTKTPSSGLPGCSIFDFCNTSDGGYMIAGNTFGYNEGESGHVFLLKTDLNGDKVWSKIYANYTDNVGVSLKETPDRGYILAGTSYLTLPNGPYTCEIELTKTDHSGNVLWSKAFIEGGYTFGHSVDNTIEGGFIISGKAVNPNSYDFDVYLIKTNSQGDTLWTTFYESLGNGYGGVIVKQSSDEGYIVTGQTDDGWGHSNVFLLKTDKNGKTTGIANSIVSVKKSSYSTYPNPVNDILTIQRDDSSKILVELVDIQGRVIFQEENTKNPIRIDVRKYNAGPYVLKVIDGSKIVTRLVMKAN